MNAQQTELIDAFQTLRASLSTLAKHVIETDHALDARWAPTPTESKLPREKVRARAAHHFCSLWYEDALPSWQGGLIAASDTTLQAAEAVNKAKTVFKARVLELRNENPAGRTLAKMLSSAPNANSRTLEQSHRRQEDVAAALRAAGLSGLNLQQCYRHIRCLPADITAVSWNWIRTAVVSKLTKQQALEKIARIRGDHKRTAREMASSRVAALPDHSLVAIKRNLAVQLRANIWIQHKPHVPIQAHSPFLFPAADRFFPETTWHQNEPDERRRKLRRDRTVSDVLICEALNMYYYSADVPQR